MCPSRVSQRSRDIVTFRCRGFTNNLFYARWDSLTTEFFDDDAVLKISCYLEDGLKHFAVSNRLEWTVEDIG